MHHYILINVSLQLSDGRSVCRTVAKTSFGQLKLILINYELVSDPKVLFTLFIALPPLHHL